MNDQLPFAIFGGVKHHALFFVGSSLQYLVCVLDGEKIIIYSIENL